MSEKQVNKIIGKIFNELADTLVNGEYGKKPRIGVTTLGSEHSEDNIIKACINCHNKGIDVTLIGSKGSDTVKSVKVKTESESHAVMESMIKLNEIDAAVTMHYTFPIGVSTVGRIITPSRGNEMFIATTAGTSSMERVPGMVQNAIYGIITAKACGIKNPTVGILNVEGARQVETALKKLKRGGYDIQFAQSKRSEGGIVMRGNDLLSGTCNVMVMDSFTGNLVVKIFSSFTTGGNYETIGYGYGPGISQDYDKLILIISRASGIPMIEGAIEFAAELVKGNCLSIAREEFEKAKKAGLDELLKSLSTNEIDEEEVVIPKKEIVTSQISAIEITELEEAVKLLWKNGIYAEIGMGCTGGVILVNDINRDLALKILSKYQYLDNN